MTRKPPPTMERNISALADGPKSWDQIQVALDMHGAVMSGVLPDARRWTDRARAWATGRLLPAGVTGSDDRLPSPLIAGNRAEHDREQKPLKRNHAGVREDARGYEKRIAGKKKANEETCFNENDRANERSASGAD